MVEFGKAVAEAFSKELILAHLDEVLGSSAFAKSPRCQDFLRYVTLQCVDGQGAVIKERTIALEVFGKGEDYESGESSAVRVRAAEVRRRLNQFYSSEANACQFRIDLPLGSYVPRFLPVDAGPAEAELPQVGANRRKWWVFCAIASLATILVVSFWIARERKPSELDRLWVPAFQHNEPVLIFLPVLADQGRGDRVGIGAAHGAAQLAGFLARRGHPFQLKFGDELTYGDLRKHPTILLGAFSRYWTSKMAQGLRFRFDHAGRDSVIVDSQSGKRWASRGDDKYPEEDYAIVARLFDPQSGQPLFLATGISTIGTLGAAECLVDESAFRKVFGQVQSGWERKNFEVVISMRVIGTTPGAPELQAIHLW